MPSIVQTFALLFVGLALLTLGAEVLVRGASRTARALGLSPLFTGLTIVAYGTSMPELVVSTVAELRDLPSVAMGNVVGSNIFNTGIVLGAAALIRPLPCQIKLVRLEMPLVVAITVALLLFSLDGRIATIEAASLLLGLVGYTYWAYRQGQREAVIAILDPQLAPSGGGLGRSPLLVLVGLAMLVAGASWLVDGAIDLARLLGISEIVIGLTIVAAGTSLPEFATSVVAAARGETDIAIGNVLGSNIFNILGVVGLAGLISPIDVAAHFTRLDIPVAIAAGLACFPIVLRRGRISRRSGIVLLLGYIVYCALLYMRSTPAW